MTAGHGKWRSVPAVVSTRTKVVNKTRHRLECLFSSYPVYFERVAAVRRERPLSSPRKCAHFQSWSEPQLRQDSLKCPVYRHVVHLCPCFCPPGVDVNIRKLLVHTTEDLSYSFRGGQRPQGDQFCICPQRVDRYTLGVDGSGKITDDYYTSRCGVCATNGKFPG